MTTTKTHLFMNREDGFTLVETLVAIMVAVIVLTMATTVLFSTHSSGVKILTKQEASANT